MMKTLYETDFHAWIEQQTQLLKKNDLQKLDIQHLIEEMETLGQSERDAIESHLIIIMHHMLKKMIQPERDGKSWDDSIACARGLIMRKIRKVPSLQNHPRSVYLECYEDARRMASKETNLDIRKIPMSCPWSLKEILGD